MLMAAVLSCSACVPLSTTEAPTVSPPDPLAVPSADWTKNIPLLLPAIHACLPTAQALPAVVADARQLDQGQSAITIRDANAVLTGCVYDDRTRSVIRQEPITVTLEERHYSVFFSPIERWFPGEQPCNVTTKVRDLQNVLIGWTCVTDCKKDQAAERHYREVTRPEQAKALAKLKEQTASEQEARDYVRFLVVEIEPNYPDAFVPRSNPAVLENAYLAILYRTYCYLRLLNQRLYAKGSISDELPHWRDGLADILYTSGSFSGGKYSKTALDKKYKKLIEDTNDIYQALEQSHPEFYAGQEVTRKLPPSLWRLEAPEDFQAFVDRLIYYCLLTFRTFPEELRGFLELRK